jgi:small subunit ribosomal protein S13
MNTQCLKRFLMLFKGIGAKVSEKICLLSGFSFKVPVEDLTVEEFDVLDRLVRDRVSIDQALTFIHKRDILRSQRIKSYVGRRHSKGLPTRGQRTHSNSSTAKKLSFYKVVEKLKIKAHKKK